MNGVVYQVVIVKELYKETVSPPVVQSVYTQAQEPHEKVLVTPSKDVRVEKTTETPRKEEESKSVSYISTV